MWDRVTLKERAKAAFQKNYWRCVIVSFILLLLFGGGSSASNAVRDRDSSSDGTVYDSGIPVLSEIGNHVPTVDQTKIHIPLLRGVLTIVFGVVSIVFIILKIFIISPIEIGGCRFFLENAYESPGVGKLLFAFESGNYTKMVLTMFLRDLYIGLWSLLLVIPGIVKSYEYRMVTYLLADCPDMSRQDAFRISKELMNGNKMDAFVLDLSFIGWNILTAVTCGIVGVFYAEPYQNATNAELYLELKQQYYDRQNHTTYTGY